jgi:hypothetical protein
MKHKNMRSSRISVSIKSFMGAVLCLALLLVCPLVYGQVSDRAHNRTSEGQENRNVGLSDLAKDNLSRVPASSVQIRTVLV